MMFMIGEDVGNLPIHHITSIATFKADSYIYEHIYMFVDIRAASLVCQLSFQGSTILIIAASLHILIGGPQVIHPHSLS